MQQFPDETRNIVKILLTLLAEGFKNQKGEIFAFGQDSQEEGTSKYKLEEMDQAKLAGAPVNNLDAERSAGFVNYELKQRGAKELGTASKTQVKAKVGTC